MTDELTTHEQTELDGLVLTQSELDIIKRLIDEHNQKARAVLEWRTPENIKAAQRSDMVLAGWVRPLLHDYFVLLNALQPFGTIWDTWVLSRIIPNSEYFLAGDDEFIRFLVDTDEYQANPFRIATEIYDTLPEKDMPQAPAEVPSA